MATRTAVNPDAFVGREPERLTLEERHAVAGKWIALQIYSPKTLPLRRIEALGDNVPDCVRQLASRGLEPRDFEYQLLSPPY
jgi:hypothetical protein